MDAIGRACHGLAFAVLALAAVLAPSIAVLGRQNLPVLIGATAAAAAVLRMDLVLKPVRDTAAIVAAVHAFLALGLLSAWWSIDSPRTLHVALSNYVIVLSGLALCAVGRDLTGDGAAKITRLTGWGLVAAIALMIALHATDLWPLRMWQSLIGGEPPHVTHLKPVAIHLAVILPIVLHAIAQAPSPHSHPMRALAFIALASVFLGTAFVIGARAAVVGGGVGAAAVFLYRLWPRLVLWALVAWVALGILFAVPLAREVMRSEAVAAAIQRLGPSAEHRRIVWIHAGDLVRLRPLLGHGLGTARVVPEGQRFVLLDPALAQAPPYDGYPIQLVPLHPHNLALETALELGVAGIALIAFIALLLVLPMAVRPTPPMRWGGCVGVLAAVFTIQNLSFSAWNASFLTMVMIAAALVLVGSRPSGAGADTLSAPSQAQFVRN
jgi:O-antigen ligase